MKVPVRALIAGLLILALAAPVAGCGRKPSDLRPPEDADPERYPRTYPAS